MNLYFTPLPINLMPLAKFKVRKRDGREERFSFQKLHVSIHQAFKRAKARDHDIASAVAHEVRDDLLKKKKKVVTVGQIERSVEKILRKRKMKNVADSYTLVFLSLKKPKIKSVRKRDGRVQKFEPKKVFKSVCKAFRQAGEPIDKECEKVTQQIINHLEKKHKREAVRVEHIKKAIYAVLEKKHKKVAKAYLTHRYL